MKHRLFYLPLVAMGLFSISIGHTGAQESAERTNAKQPHPPNRLSKESSPYLLQHAHNPVDWYPWGEEAFEQARQQNKPIFLSIGYSSCFWCHVMERKVFENEEIAAYMNEHFINIKVDREERPDIDEIYMLSLQVYFQLAGSPQGGGWPLSMFLTPNGEPIAGGTYFPPEDMEGRPGFLTVMKQLSSAWGDQRPAVQRTATAVSQEVKRLSQPQLSLDTLKVNLNDVAVAVEDVISGYDPQFGGFDFLLQTPDKPKFPVPSKLFLIQAQLAQETEISQVLATKLDHSLIKMAEGGIYDQLGGGFHRYSTDREWLVPHFEKMLYDNAQLAEVYAEAYQRTQRQQYREVVEGIFNFIEETMTSPGGGFYSALDAETDGVEGLYYVWSKSEIQAILAPTGYRYFETAYGLDQKKTFEHGYVLHLPRSIADSAQLLGVPVQEMNTRLGRMRNELLAKRRTRKPLRRDDKILTSWNGLMIRAYARAGKILQKQDYIERAAKASLFVLSNLRDREGRLLRTTRNQQKSLPAYLDDYAFLVSGLLALHDATKEDKWLNAARLLTDQQISLFADNENGGFYFTSHDHESLIARTKSAYDSVLPSGNSVSIQNLIRLSQLTGDRVYLDVAGKTMNAFRLQLRQSPGSLAYFSLASQEYLTTLGSSVPNAVGSNLFDGGVSSSQPQNTKPVMKTAEKDQPDDIVVHLKSGAVLNDKAKINAEGFFSQAEGIAGGQIKIAIQIKIDEGWHINANPAQPDFVIPTKLELSGETPLQLVDVKYPKGKEFRLAGIEEPLLVYEGTVVIQGTLVIPGNSQGEFPVSIKVKSQACNNQTCFPPTTLVLTGNLPVLQQGEKANPTNKSLFTK